MAFLSLAYLLLGRGRRKPTGQRYRKLQLGVSGIILSCILGEPRRSAHPWPLGPDPGWRISRCAEPTRTLLEDLDDVVTIRFFASRDLPSQAELVKRDTEDLLADYVAVGGGQISLEKIEDVDESSRRRVRHSAG